jgi:hypothetical protein
VAVIWFSRGVHGGRRRSAAKVDRGGAGDMELCSTAAVGFDGW